MNTRNGHPREQKVTLWTLGFCTLMAGACGPVPTDPDALKEGLDSTGPSMDWTEASDVIHWVPIESDGQGESADAALADDQTDQTDQADQTDQFDEIDPTPAYPSYVDEGCGSWDPKSQIFVSHANDPCESAERCLVAIQEEVSDTGQNSLGVCTYVDPEHLLCLPVKEATEAWSEGEWDSGEEGGLPDGAYVPGPCQNRRCGDPEESVDLEEGHPCNTGDPCDGPSQTHVCDGQGHCTGPGVTFSPKACHQVSCISPNGVAEAEYVVDDLNLEDDGNACTTDACLDGVPEHEPVVCPVDPASDACTYQSCEDQDGVATCVPKNKDDGTVCSDGQGCTTGDQCQSGVCVGQAVSCGGPIAPNCPDPHCEAVGSDGFECVTPKTSPVTGVALCLPGVSFAPNRCAEAGEVVNDGCLICSADGVWELGTACDDGKDCTLGDACVNGACTHDMDLRLITTTLECQELDCSASGTTNIILKPDYCIYNNVCVPLNGPLSMDDCHKCMVPEGAPAGTKPAVLPLTGGTCNDSDPSTPTGQCDNGLCKITAVVCAQDLPCALFSTADSCSVPHRTDFTQCLLQHPNIADSWACYGVGAAHPTDECLTCTLGADGVAVFAPNVGASCKGDLDNCVTEARCSATGQCVAVTKKECNDNPCAASGFCVPTQGLAPLCIYNPKNDFTSCTTPCGTGVCIAGSCTQQCACNPSECDDGNPCTSHSCDAVQGCVQSPSNQGAACETGDACLAEGQCLDGQCVGQPVQCDDGNSCTVDSCDSVAGCSHEAADGLPCSDSNACTLGDLCQATVCVPGFYDTCDDNNQCTSDYCDPGVGCKHLQNPLPPAPEQCQAYLCDPATGGLALTDLNSGACDDGSSCTVNDQCNQGECLGTGLCNRGFTVSNGQVVTTPYIQIDGTAGTVAVLMKLATFGNNGPVVFAEARSQDGSERIRLMAGSQAGNPAGVDPGEFLVAYISGTNTSLYTTGVMIPVGEWTQVSLGYDGDSFLAVSTKNAQKSYELTLLQGPASLPLGFLVGDQLLSWTLGGKADDSGIGVHASGSFTQFSLWNQLLGLGSPKYASPNLWCAFVQESANHYEDLDSVVALYHANELQGQELIDASGHQPDACLGTTCDVDARDATRAGWVEAFRMACGPMD